MNECGGRHGLAIPRGHTALAPGAHGGRFGRMFGSLPRRVLGTGATDALFHLIEARSKEGDGLPNECIPAGYTYLGQFVDHDITFDPTSVLGRDNDPHALANFRTPRYDLDSLYGSGPQDQPFLYEWDSGQPGVKLLVGHNPPVPGLAEDKQPAAVDLPRNERGRALIGDARNDENLIVSQLHLLFIHFHNEVVDRLYRDDHVPHDGASLFEEARRIVRWHYQWIVVHDFLERLVGKPMAHSVMRPGEGGRPPAITRRFYTRHEEPAVPVEFSAAAFRCGHSMVRPDYTPGLRDGVGLPILSRNDGREHFGGFRRLPKAVVIDWERFFRVLPNVAINISKAIDERITMALFSLPPDGKRALPRLNLERARALGLPAGPDVANAMGLKRLTKEQLLLDRGPAAPHADELLRATPLWYYILREAKVLGGVSCEDEGRATAGMTLGPVGGRIVAEVLVGLLEGDPQSYLRQWPSWTPKEESEALRLRTPGGSIETMADLVRFVRGDL